MSTYTIEARFLKGTGTIRRAEYHDGSLALLFDYEDGEGWDRLSINLTEYGITAPPGHIWVKTYAEHEGLPEALQAAGVARMVEAEPATFGDFGTQAILMEVLA